MPAPLRAWLVAGSRGGGEVARWRSSAAQRRGAAMPCSGVMLAVGGDLVAADAAVGDAGSLEVADVIYRRDGPEPARPMTWLCETLDRYPGCAVAAIPEGGGGYLALSKLTCLLATSFLIPNDHELNALVCAMFAYGWLAAGWPLADLEHDRLEASAALRLSARKMIARTAELISFGLFYEGPAPAPASSADPSWPSRRRMSLASGASTSE